MIDLNQCTRVYAGRAPHGYAHGTAWIGGARVYEYGERISPNACSFCGNPPSKDHVVVKGPRANICGECAGLAAKAIEERGR